MQITTQSFHKPIKVYYFFKVIYFNSDNNIIIPQAHKGMFIEIRVHLTKLLAFKDGKKAHFSKSSQN